MLASFLLGLGICLDLVAVVALVMPSLFRGGGYATRVYLDGRVEYYVAGEEGPASWFVSRFTCPSSGNPAPWGLGGFLAAGAAFFVYGTVFNARVPLWVAGGVCVGLSASLVPFVLRNRQPQSDLEAHLRAGTLPDDGIENERG